MFNKPHVLLILKRVSARISRIVAALSETECVVCAISLHTPEIGTVVIGAKDKSRFIGIYIMIGEANILY